MEVLRDSKGRFVKGHSFSSDMLKKMSENSKGRLAWNKGTKGIMKAWNKGIPHSEQTKQRMSENHQSKKEGYVSCRKGKKHSEESKLQISQTRKNKLLSGERSHSWKGGSPPYYSSIARKTLVKKYRVPWNELCLPEDYVIHHIDRNKKNNGFENLCVMTRADHTKFHIRGEI
jgi:hypothetical protein